MCTLSADCKCRVSPLSAVAPPTVWRDSAVTSASASSTVAEHWPHSVAVSCPTCWASNRVKTAGESTAEKTAMRQKFTKQLIV